MFRLSLLRQSVSALPNIGILNCQSKISIVNIYHRILAKILISKIVNSDSSFPRQNLYNIFHNTNITREYG